MNCFNGEKYLKEAIESVLNQNYLNWELIFWDNQSTDNSKAIFDSFKDVRLKYFYAPDHTDLGGARSNAFEFLQGEFIAILDTDDLWLPSKLDKQINLFSNPDVGIVISDTVFFSASDERVLYNGKYPPEGDVFRNLLTNYFVSLETLMLRKSIIERLDYSFDPDFSYIADFDLVLRVASISKLAICKEVLAKWRVHESSDSWKSSISFSVERERWIEKQTSQDPDFLNRYREEIAILHSKNFLLMAIDALSKNRRIQAFKLVMKASFKKYHDYAVLFLCFIPFSNILLKYLLKRRVKRLLR
tara:strand:- start:4387 stop:5292 length:906 start_codon:yes stop_codon:yes gene_type:complete